jgi:hypothetical protein
MKPTETPTPIKLSKLTIDPGIIDLRPVNDVFVSRYRQAMRQGATFPPLVVDTTNNIVSGNHRFEAAWQEFGSDHAFPCIVRRYPSEAERIEDAIRENANHGNPMDGITRKRAILRLTELGRSASAIASLLGVSAKRVEELAGISVVVIGGRTQPVKRGLEHMAGRSVTPEQYDGHRQQDKGMPAASIANQLIRWIENGWIDWTDETTRDAMTRLQSAINGAMSE